jgi:TIGR03009 family protein
MSGAMTANAALNRFDLKVAKEEEFYVHLEVRPRLDKDKSEFAVMTLVLFGPKAGKVAYLPRVVVIRKNNNQDEEFWDFPSPAVNLPNMNAAAYQFQQPAKDWKMKKLQPGPAPGAPAVPPTGAPKPPGS